MSSTKAIHPFADWLANHVPYPIQAILPIVGDASSRAFFRVITSQQTFILMDSSKDKTLSQFIQLAKALSTQQIPVPTIFASDLKQGYALLTDLGYQTFYDALNTTNTTWLYQRALKTLLTFQKVKLPNTISLPIMDKDFFCQQLNLFKEWYLQRYLNLSPCPNSIDELTEFFTAYFPHLPQSLVHLDFHSKNLILSENQQIGIVDFQDAKLGPIFYDLISLLQDAYVHLPRGYTLEWLHQYQTQHPSLNQRFAFADLVKMFDIVGVQRHLKNLGVFARLALRDHKPGYLKFMPILMKHILNACNLYPELKDLSHWLHHTVLAYAYPMPHFTTQAEVLPY